MPKPDSDFESYVFAISMPCCRRMIDSLGRAL